MNFSIEPDVKRDWCKGMSVNGFGRVLIYKPSHPNALSNGYMFRSRVVVEKAIGKILDKKHEVHHVDGNKANDNPNNLVACEDRKYHGLLHQRQRALDACGHADWEKCSICGEYSRPEELKKEKKSRFHAKCRNQRRREKYALGLTRW